MERNKKIALLLIGGILALLLIAGTLICLRIHDKNSWHFDVKDTLPEGNGKKATVILLGGQSNAAGCSSDEYLKQNTSPEQYAEYEQGYGNVYINYYTTGTNLSRAFVNCTTRQGEMGTHFGPELGMAERLHELYPDETFFIIKCTWSGTCLFNQWLSPSCGSANPLYRLRQWLFSASDKEAGFLYRGFVEYVNTSLKYLKSKGYDVQIEAMCWMQGESDSFAIEHATNYAANLTGFIADIRKEFSRDAAEDGIAFIDAYIADNPAYWVYCDEVNACKKQVAKADSMNALVDTVGAGLSYDREPADNPDLAHYDSLSEIKLGHLFAEEMVPFLD